MPLYEYHCPTCSHKFEKLQPMSATGADCPNCEQPAKRAISVFARVGNATEDLGLRTWAASSHGWWRLLCRRMRLRPLDRTPQGEQVNRDTNGVGPSHSRRLHAVFIEARLRVVRLPDGSPTGATPGSRRPPQPA